MYRPTAALTKLALNGEYTSSSSTGIVYSGNNIVLKDRSGQLAYFPFKEMYRRTRWGKSVVVGEH
jgi:hypothetical protein